MKKILWIAIIPPTLCILCWGLISLMVYDQELEQQILRESLQTPQHISIEDLTGIWEHPTHYGKELLILREDLTFRQIFTSGKEIFDVSGRWWIEPVKKGGFRLHLEGARFYSWGVEFALREGMDPPGGGLPERPMIFWDLFTNEGVEMPHKLVLQIRILPSEEIVLHTLHPPHEIMLLGDIYRKTRRP